jgi:hypothetical protein
MGLIRTNSPRTGDEIAPKVAPNDVFSGPFSGHPGDVSVDVTDSGPFLGVARFQVFRLTLIFKP